MTTPVQAQRPKGSPVPVDPESRGSAIRRQWLRIEQFAAVAVLVALPIRKAVGPGVTLGLVLAALLIPVWIVAVRRFWGAWLFLAVGLAAVVSGLVLSKLAAIDHGVDSSDMLSTTFLVLGMLGGVGVILWSRQILSIAAIGTSFGIGALINIASQTDRTALQVAIGPDSQWKAGWGIATTILVLALVARASRVGWQLLALLILAAISIVFDGRSLFATFLLAAVLIFWQSRPKLSTGRLSWVWTAGLLGTLGFLMYLLGSTLLVDGYLGAEAQAKSIQQIDQAGSLILGGRPELSASWALFTSRPWGFGSGVLPNFGDIMAARAGMVSINYDPNNGYVDKYMFGSGIELHSVLSDCWSHFGFAGIAFVATIGFLVVRGAAIAISKRAASAIVLTMVCYTLWNLLFSPLYASTPLLMLTVGLSLTHRTGLPATEESTGLSVEQPDRSADGSGEGPRRGQVRRSEERAFATGRVMHARETF